MGTLEIQKQHLPDKPGVYVFRNAAGKILYVGKAKLLKRRVLSYFQKKNSLEPSKRLMVQKIADIDYMVTRSEVEALLLESTLIKKHTPPYNIILRNDKFFLYIKIPFYEEFPTVIAVRRVAHDKARYFGPFTSAIAVRSTLKLLKQLFQYRTCVPHQGKACFDVHLHRCVGPCYDAITPADYRKQVVEPILDFLQGKEMTIEKRFRNEMRAAADHKDFERAAVLRDRLRAISKVTEHQSVITPGFATFDVLGFARDRDWAVINLFPIRQGKLQQKLNFVMQQLPDAPDSDVIKAFMEQYYPRAMDKPKQIFVGLPLDGRSTMERLLGVRIAQPERGKKRQLLKMSNDNAADYLERQRATFLASANRSRLALEKLLQALKLPSMPNRIECYDISNNQGVHAVGSMVVFENGLPAKKEYKKFSIKYYGNRTLSVPQPNDFAMMAEMLTRRLQHKEWKRPDLIILDGGKGQLSTVWKATRDLRDGIPLAALAKREEELFLPGREKSVLLPRGSEALFLVQRIRDEAHRFAITFYRGTHGKATIHSALDDVAGIGPKTKKLLIKKFGSVKGIREASAEDVEKLVGKKKAEALWSGLPE